VGRALCVALVMSGQKESVTLAERLDQSIKPTSSLAIFALAVTKLQSGSVQTAGKLNNVTALKMIVRSVGPVVKFARTAAIADSQIAELKRCFPMDLAARSAIGKRGSSQGFAYYAKSVMLS
jgi:hypothetical protein